MTSPRVLIPFDKREALTLREATSIAGRSTSTLRGWCANYHIGRRVVGGPWMVSRVALAMLLDDDRVALESYLSGDRETMPVRRYLGSVIDKPMLLQHAPDPSPASLPAGQEP